MKFRRDHLQYLVPRLLDRRPEERVRWNVTDDPSTRSELPPPHEPMAELDEMRGALAKGNEWAQKASMIIAVHSKVEDDCLVAGREYFLFDTGMATALLILRAVELGLVAHPIAGFDEERVKEVLGLGGEDFTSFTIASSM